MDDEIRHGEGAFNHQLAGNGYAVTIISGDGQSITFDSREIAMDYWIIVANVRDGESPGTFKLVGPKLNVEEIIKDVVEIRLHCFSCFV